MNALLGHPRRTERWRALQRTPEDCTLAKEGGSTVQGGGSLEERNNPRAPIVSDNVPYRTSIFFQPPRAEEHQKRPYRPRSYCLGSISTDMI